MFDRIVLPYDGLESTGPSIEFAMSFSNLLNSSLFVVNVIENTSLLYAAKCLESRKVGKNVKNYCIKRAKTLYENILEKSKKYKVKIERQSSFQIT